jgi:hypothetical protein
MPRTVSLSIAPGELQEKNEGIGSGTGHRKRLILEGYKPMGKKGKILTPMG